MRLTAELINHSLSYLNPLKERELDLRGHRIPAIENLGVAGAQDSIDLTDNDIQLLGNFPLSPRLQTLLLAHNRISAIQQSLPAAIPRLRNLVLTSNNLSELSDLEILGQFPLLTHLSLLGNPVTKKENYRYWVLWHCANVRFLDFQKVKLVERQKAKELFGSHETPTELASTIMGAKSNTFDIHAANGAGAPSSKMSRLITTDKENKKLKQMIKNASSMDEILRLEKALNEGRLPPGLVLDDDEEEEEEDDEDDAEDEKMQE